MAITARQQVKLRALANPEDAEGYEAHRVNQDIRPQAHERLPEVSLGAAGAQRWYRQAKHEQGHADCEDAVRNAGKAIQVRARELVEAVPAPGQQIHPVRMTEA